MEYEFSVQTMVQGYHIYQNIWDAACDGELLNWRVKYLEGKNLANHDSFAKFANIFPLQNFPTYGSQLYIVYSGCLKACWVENVGRIISFMSSM